MGFSQGPKNKSQDSYGKQAISVWATEVLLYWVIVISA